MAVQPLTITSVALPYELRAALAEEAERAGIGVGNFMKELLVAEFNRRRAEAGEAAFVLPPPRRARRVA